MANIMRKKHKEDRKKEREQDWGWFLYLFNLKYTQNGYHN